MYLYRVIAVAVNGYNINLWTTNSTLQQALRELEKGLFAPNFDRKRREVRWGKKRDVRWLSS